MIFDIPALVAHVSSVMTLLPGDVILTGTPEGVGPMEVGDEVEVSIAGLGSLTNRIAPDEHAPPPPLPCGSGWPVARPGPRTSASCAPPSSTGPSPVTTAARSCCASRTPTASAAPRSPTTRSSTCSAGSASTGTRASRSVVPTVPTGSPSAATSTATCWTGWPSRRYTYDCFCTNEEVDARHKASGSKLQGYDGFCRELTAEQKAAFEAEGRRPVVRFRMPDGLDHLGRPGARRGTFDTRQRARLRAVRAPTATRSTRSSTRSTTP